VLIESACFDPISIRKTSKALGLNTDASHRFERGVDPDGTLFALNRAAGLMVDLGHGRLVGGTIDEDYRNADPLILTLGVEATNDLLGTDLDRDRMASLLESIAFKVEGRRRRRTSCKSTFLPGGCHPPSGSNGRSGPAFRLQSNSHHLSCPAGRGHAPFFNDGPAK
jgi:phenylalanyl-tRNA synthetase beta subunit